MMIEIVNPGFKWSDLSIEKMPSIEKHLERCGRVCYKSEDKITPESSERFVRNICRNKHESVLEHEVLTAHITCSRSCSHQLVRHRLAAYSQESQRYCNYGRSDGLRVICPPSIGLAPGQYHIDEMSMRKWDNKQLRWLACMEMCYVEYLVALDEGIKPEDARYVLPNACKTEVVTTFNLRQWRHVLKTRCDSHAQWEIRGVMDEIRRELIWRLTSVFEDLKYV
jgi:thymidylate synthase (FAD)